jgi:outer membrane protein TolC
VLALALALPAAGALSAQQVPPRLTVADALRLAREHNPVLRRAANDADVAAWQVRQAWAAFLPTLSTGLGFGANRSTSLSGVDDFGQPVSSPITRTFTSSSASQSINSSLLLFDGGANIRQLAARRAEARATDRMVEAQAAAVTAVVERAWYQALRAQQNIALEEQLLTSARDRLERAEALLRLAAMDQVDVLGARADVATQQRNLERAAGDARKSRLSLLQAIGLEPTGDFELAGELAAVFDPSPLDADSLVALALRINPVVQQRALQASAQRRGNRLPAAADLAERELWPEHERGGLGRVRRAGCQFSASFGINVRLPLFGSFQPSALATANAAWRTQEDLRAGAAARGAGALGPSTWSTRTARWSWRSSRRRSAGNGWSWRRRNSGWARSASPSSRT